MDYIETIKKLNHFLKTNLSEKRYSHSLRSSKAAVELAKKIPGLENKLKQVELAALTHDIARELPFEEQFKLVKEAGLKISRRERNTPLLIHGKAAVSILKNNWEITDPSILNAVRFHTVGDPAMDDLAKVVFIADFIEPGRKYHKDWPWLSVQQPNLNAILLGVLEESEKYLRSKGKTVHPETIKLEKRLKRTEKKAKKEKKKKSG